MWLPVTVSACGMGRGVHWHRLQREVTDVSSLEAKSCPQCHAHSQNPLCVASHHTPCLVLFVERKPNHSARSRGATLTCRPSSASVGSLRCNRVDCPRRVIQLHIAGLFLDPTDSAQDKNVGGPLQSACARFQASLPTNPCHHYHHHHHRGTVNDMTPCTHHPVWRSTSGGTLQRRRTSSVARWL